MFTSVKKRFGGSKSGNRSSALQAALSDVKEVVEKEQQHRMKWFGRWRLTEQNYLIPKYECICDCFLVFSIKFEKISFYGILKSCNFSQSPVHILITLHLFKQFSIMGILSIFRVFRGQNVDCSILFSLKFDRYLQIADCTYPLAMLPLFWYAIFLDFFFEILLPSDIRWLKSMAFKMIWKR